MKFKKYKIWIVLTVILLSLLVWLELYYGKNEVHEKNKAEIDNFPADASSKEDSSTPAGKFSQYTEDNKTYNKTYLAKRVIDGDTIELGSGERVRYIGIDTPETVDPRKSIQCFGKEATRANRELVEGKLVRLEKDVSDKDKYGRLLRYVYEGDRFVNLELIKRGYAYAYTYPPDVKNSKIFLDAQKIAREARLGLWGACDKI